MGQDVQRRFRDDIAVVAEEREVAGDPVVVEVRRVAPGVFVLHEIAELHGAGFLCKGHGRHRNHGAGIGAFGESDDTFDQTFRHEIAAVGGALVACQRCARHDHDRLAAVLERGDCARGEKPVG